jgi:O-antigen biosynthesis protein WbqP
MVGMSLPIEVKARLDGEYARNMSFKRDIKCFFGTMVSVLKHDDIVERGTGNMLKFDYGNSNNTNLSEQNPAITKSKEIVTK